MKAIIFIGLILVCGCMDYSEKTEESIPPTTLYTESVKNTPYDGIGLIQKFYIESDNVTCYARSAYNQGGLSCIVGNRMNNKTIAIKTT